jgi:hypothetical protein
VPRFVRLALLPFVLWALPGCLWQEHAETSNWMKQFRRQALSPDHALIELAMIELPRGDEFINDELWKHTDEFVVQDKRRILDENGFRIGQLVGPPPENFQKLLLSPRACSNPQALIFPPGKTATIPFPLTQQKLAYDFVREGERTEIVLDQTRFCFDVTARFDREGKTIVTFTPKVEHAAAVLPFQASSDNAEWELRTGKAAQKHAELGWEVTLGPNQYLFIGGRLDRDNTLGQAAFTMSDGADEIQRLLVVRNCRAVTSTESQQQSAQELIHADRTTPLAVQATVPAVRGKSN